MTTLQTEKVNVSWLEITPAQAWHNHIISLMDGTDDTRCWEPEQLIGYLVDVCVPNGLTGEQYKERNLSVTVTAEMVKYVRVARGDIK